MQKENSNELYMKHMTDKELVEIVEASYELGMWREYDVAFEELRERGYFA